MNISVNSDLEMKIEQKYDDALKYFKCIYLFTKKGIYIKLSCAPFKNVNIVKLN
jgi:hypothetical protein